MESIICQVPLKHWLLCWSIIHRSVHYKGFLCLFYVLQVLRCSTTFSRTDPPLFNSCASSQTPTLPSPGKFSQKPPSSLFKLHAKWRHNRTMHRCWTSFRKKAIWYTTCTILSIQIYFDVVAQSFWKIWQLVFWWP